MQTFQKPEFIDDDGYESGGVGKNDDETNELYDHVCAICDNGGEILWYAICLKLSFICQ